MKNKLKVNIYNRTYNLLSEESQEYTNKLALVINSKIKGMMKAIPSLSVQDALSCSVMATSSTCMKKSPT